jgi:hypothetical protein
MDVSRQLRDLIWAVQSPSLISTFPTDTPTEFDPECVDCDHLQAFLAHPSGYRVGHYFERLILYWLRHIRQVEMIAHGLQVLAGKRTIGEIDFLFRDELGRLTHWEIAVKFYLHLPHQNSYASELIGPNAADTFEKKMARLFDHQLRLSLQTHPDVEIRQAFVKGRIFYHDQADTSERLPPLLSQSHLQNRWLFRSEVDSLPTGGRHTYRHLRKPNWISQATSQLDDPDLLHSTAVVEYLHSHFADRATPVLMSQLDRSGDQWVEVERYFIVSDQWPNEAGATKARAAHRVASNDR